MQMDRSNMKIEVGEDELQAVDLEEGGGGALDEG